MNAAMTPNQKAALLTVRFLALAGVVGGIVVLLVQESGRKVRNCFDPQCVVDPVPMAGIYVAAVAAAVFIATYIYARVVAKAVQPPTQ